MMWWYDRSEPLAWRKVYVYLKTPYALEHSYEAIEQFQDGVRRSRAEILWLGNDETWEDGFVFRTEIRMDAPDLAKTWGNALNRFEAWAILDDKGGFKESVSGGPMSRFYKKIEPPNTSKINYSQIFLLWDEENKWAEKSIEDIKTSLKRLCLPVFFFRGGVVLFLESEEAGGITIQRCRRHLNNLLGLCIIDSVGETFSSKGRDDHRWGWADFQELISTD